MKQNLIDLKKNRKILNYSQEFQHASLNMLEQVHRRFTKIDHIPGHHKPPEMKKVSSCVKSAV
jgi:hypothetical protein